MPLSTEKDEIKLKKHKPEALNLNMSLSGSHEREPSSIKYGELIVLGYNGCLPCGNRGRRRSLFALFKRPTSNGVKPVAQHTYESPKSAQAVRSTKQHSISYTLSRNQTVVVEYASDPDTDMFQIGRSTDPVIDFVVMDTVPGALTSEDCQVTESTISRFACRIVVDRDPPYLSRIYAAGFDTRNNIFLGEKACKWKTETQGGIDSLTTNGVLIMRPKGGFTPEARPGVWREVSVCGNVYSLREIRSSAQRGKLIESENNILEDGTLVDLCGATLLWRSATGLLRTPTQKHLEQLRQDINASRPQCPVGLMTLVLPSRSSRMARGEEADDKQPYVYLKCGHVHGYHGWVGKQSSNDKEDLNRTCPLCREVGPYIPVVMGNEPSFYVDSGPPTHAFCPCGHVASEKTARFWSQVPLPHGTHGFQATCPFCATPLAGEQGYVKLIFQQSE
ncbi:E3 ubiquitin-protein ligase pellino homolog 1-like [Saccoglossus kowalevskii]|uniref:E3 ubiquitin-protein ligase pellino homolog 2-like n=1 Tax=Saccoglossus kowalevskii TaxID=10224 RepID=A0ABM0GKS4_SACKO|nr:PREDICTED: E3 ubiquitin-protein ligase pellino homolog 2-like [Saccoglossus kowalevskii]